ncbi:hypothetical protein [Chitinophaga sp. YR627]|uniref:hypothetical protein n=1 Tax=Chitinophaga sp. YR627 TaxID=1881041 RepID=UPI000B7D298C|nr:hypothetical protein [Chitinophaga sp. YR627]
MITLQSLITMLLTGTIFSWSNKSPVIQPAVKGLFVWHYMIRQKPSEKFVELMAPDSIFYHNGYAIESLIRINEVQDADGKLTSNNVQNGYHVIDFNKRQFFRYASLTALQNSPKENWLPIEDKKIGVRFTYPFYNGEKFVSKDTIMDNRHYRVISFINSGVQAKGAAVTLYMEPNLSSPIPFYTIQKNFKGRLSMISIVDKLGETRIELEYQQATADSTIYKILSEMQKSASE